MTVTPSFHQQGGLPPPCCKSDLLRDKQKFFQKKKRGIWKHAFPSVPRICSRQRGKRNHLSHHLKALMEQTDVVPTRNQIAITSKYHKK